MPKEKKTKASRKSKKTKEQAVFIPDNPVSEGDLFQEIARMIEQARHKVVCKINSEMVELYWNIGKRIKQDLVKTKRAEYGKVVVEKLAEDLQSRYGKGFNRRNLFHMVHFFDVLPDHQIVYTLCTQLSWSHFRELIYISDDLKRTFYMEMCQHER